MQLDVPGRPRLLAAAVPIWGGWLAIALLVFGSGGPGLCVPLGSPFPANGYFMMRTPCFALGASIFEAVSLLVMGVLIGFAYRAAGWSARRMAVLVAPAPIVVALLWGAALAVGATDTLNPRCALAPCTGKAAQPRTHPYWVDYVGAP